VLDVAGFSGFSFQVWSLNAAEKINELPQRLSLWGMGMDI
jgi:hypothetical protein